MLWFPVYVMQRILNSYVFCSPVNGLVCLTLTAFLVEGITGAFGELIPKDQALQMYVQLQVSFLAFLFFYVIALTS